jgi:hypothetical protein
VEETSLAPIVRPVCDPARQLNHALLRVAIRRHTLSEFYATLSISFVASTSAGLVLRLVARDGYLGSMRTVHFAHWAFLDNGSRLLFFSNFDRRWGSYLDDFIEKAHAGLTLAWGCGVGFPPTRFLIYDGASHGRQFKNWALASRAVSRFWYSAYPDLTVDQVERNNRIANGLRKATLQDREAATWLQDL